MHVRLQLFLRYLALIGGTGYTLCFFSERMFWSFARPTDGVMDYAATWLVYCVLAYVLLACLYFFKISSLWALFVAGALVGWLCEGVFASTLYGHEGIVFPITIAWTSLAWHAPLSVVVGCYALPRALHAGKSKPIIILSSALGLFWGLWASAWGLETPPMVATPFDYGVHALITTGLLVLSQFMIAWGRPAAFQPGKKGVIAVSLLILAAFGVMIMPAIPYAPLILLPLLVFGFFLLSRHKKRETTPVFLHANGQTLPAKNMAYVFLMPVISTVVYSGLNAWGLIVPVNAGVFIIASVGGAGLFCMASWKILNGKN